MNKGVSHMIATINKNDLVALGSVSYTHLDVYKRQVNEYETRTGNLVYLVIADNHLINLLYVSKAEKGISKVKQAKIWQKEFNNNIFGWVNACVINPNNPTSYVHEDIFIGTCQGILGRIK